MVGTSDIKNGMIIKFRGKLYEIIEFLHVKPGKGAAFVRTKLKDIKTGKVIDNTFRTSEKLEDIRIEAHKKQYLYCDSDFYVFMDINTYEQLSVPKDVIGDNKYFLMEGIEVKMRFTPEQEIVGIELPVTVEMDIAEAEPNVKGNTASGSGKNAVTETGLKVTVPFFVDSGQRVKIDTRTGNYLERV